MVGVPFEAGKLYHFSGIPAPIEQIGACWSRIGIVAAWINRLAFGMCFPWKKCDNTNPDELDRISYDITLILGVKHKQTTILSMKHLPFFTAGYASYLVVTANIFSTKKSSTSQQHLDKKNNFQLTRNLENTSYHVFLSPTVYLLSSTDQFCSVGDVAIFELIWISTQQQLNLVRTWIHRSGLKNQLQVGWNSSMYSV